MWYDLCSKILLQLLCREQTRRGRGRKREKAVGRVRFQTDALKTERTGLVDESDEKCEAKCEVKDCPTTFWLEQLEE